jgi:hypothetical protein
MFTEENGNEKLQSVKAHDLWSCQLFLIKNVLLQLQVSNQA